MKKNTCQKNYVHVSIKIHNSNYKSRLVLKMGTVMMSRTLRGKKFFHLRTPMHLIMFIRHVKTWFDFEWFFSVFESFIYFLNYLKILICSWFWSFIELKVVIIRMVRLCCIINCTSKSGKDNKKKSKTFVWNYKKVTKYSWS